MPNVSQILLIICFTFTLAGCSTIEGIGKDLKKGGQAIQDATK
ncbi:MAG: putative small secreted protein [Oceanospirillaceae bacterium]|jgi:predicted small secreted protein